MSALSLNINLTGGRPGARYTLSQVLALNTGQVLLPKDLESIFAGYKMPACALERPYNNQQNVRFYDPSKPTHTYVKSVASMKGIDVYSDESILPNIRHAFASVAKGKTQLPIVRINQMIIPPSMVSEIAELFFDTITRSPQKAPEFIEVLFGIRFQDGLEEQIHKHFVKHTLDNFKNPSVLGDTSLESGELRTRAHRNATCILMACLFAHDYQSHQKNAKQFFRAGNLKERLLDPMFTKVEEGDADEVKNLVEILKILQPKYQSVIDTFSDRIVALYNDKTKFKITVRLLLKDFIK